MAACLKVRNRDLHCGLGVVVLVTSKKEKKRGAVDFGVALDLVFPLCVRGRKISGFCFKYFLGFCDFLIGSEIQ